MTSKGTKSCRWMPKWVKVPAKKIQRLFCNGKAKKSKEFAVTIEPFENGDDQMLRTLDYGGGRQHGAVVSPPLEPLALADQLECVFRRYFQRHVDQFAMANVLSERSAFGRHCQIRHAKQIVSSMVEFWEEQRHCEKMLTRRSERRGEKEGPMDALMDSYFACLYDFFARSAHILEDFYPQLKRDDGRRGTMPPNPPFFAVAEGGRRRHYIKRHRKCNFSDIGTFEERSFSLGGSVVNFGAKNGDKLEEEMRESRPYKSNRPKSIVCYF